MRGETLGGHAGPVHAGPVLDAVLGLRTRWNTSRVRLGRVGRAVNEQIGCRMRIGCRNRCEHTDKDGERKHVGGLQGGKDGTCAARVRSRALAANLSFSSLLSSLADSSGNSQERLCLGRILCPCTCCSHAPP